MQGNQGSWTLPPILPGTHKGTTLYYVGGAHPPLGREAFVCYLSTENIVLGGGIGGESEHSIRFNKDDYRNYEGGGDY